MRLSLSAMALLCVVGSALGQAKPVRLSVGDDAPPITVSKWLQGGPVNTLEKGKIYVLDFWATWCGPCRRSIPHLVKLTDKFKGKVDFIAVDVWERDPSKLEPFIAKRGDMNYAIATDIVDPLPTPKPDAKTIGGWLNEHGHMASGWLIASGRDKIGIPETFVVNGDGKIAFIGDPLELDDVLDKLVAGTYDLKKATEDYAATMSHWEKGQELTKAFDDASGKSDWKTALETSNKLIALDPVLFDGYLIEKVNILLNQLKQPDLAYSLAKESIDGLLKNDPDNLAVLAMTIALPNNGQPLKEPLPGKAYEVAFAAIDQGLATTKGSKALLYNTMARIYTQKGDKQKAIDTLQTAIAQASPDEKENMEKNLETLQKTK